MSWKVLFQVFEIDVINAWTVVWHVVSIQTFVDSVDQVMFVDSILSFSLANSKGPCLPLLKPQTINSPFSLSISAPSLYPPPPSTSEFSPEIVKQVINVPQMGSIDLGSWVIAHVCYPDLCFFQRRALLFFTSSSCANCCFNNEFHFVYFQEKLFFLITEVTANEILPEFSLDSWIKYSLC